MRRYKIGPQLRKFHFMVKEGIMLGHRISEKEIEVNRAKIETIEKLPPPTNMRGVRSFLGMHDFIDNLSGTSLILQNLCVIY